MVGGIAESVDLEFAQQVARHLGEEPIEDETAFYGALAVEEKDYFCVGGGVEGGFQVGVGEADAGGGVGEVALDEALEEVEDDAGAVGV